MANILEKIVADKRIELIQLKEKLPLESVVNELKPTKKDLYKALSKPNAGFILECKKASPSKGLIRPDFDVVSIAKSYEKYAACISVLTDEKYFQGTFDYLKAVTEAVACPVLNKDFFVEPYQVHLARYYGADAILLMLSVLTDAEYLELAEVAEKYKLAILTEISNEDLSSIKYLPSSIKGRSFDKESRDKSVRKPNLPIFIPRKGTLSIFKSLIAPIIVPSPPITKIKSTLLSRALPRSSELFGTI